MKVLVTGATRDATMAIIRGLAREGCDVIGADERRLPFNVHSGYTKPYFLYPPGYQDGFVDAILEIIKKEKPDVLLPVAGSKQIAKHKKAIEKHTKVPLPDYPSYMAAFDNQTTLEECKKLNIGCPKIWQEKDALRILKQNKTSRTPVPFILKPRADIGGALGQGIFYNEEQLRSLQNKALKYGDACIQEYIPGGPENMRTVNLLFDADGRLVTYFATKKIRQWPNSGGISVLSVSIHAPELVDFVLPFFNEWRWHGIAEAEIKLDARDQKPKLIEINPRFCGYAGFAIESGVNFPWYICQLAQGKQVEKAAYQAGIQYINWPYYLKAAFYEWVESKHKKATLTKICNELKGKKKVNNMEWADWKMIAAKALFKISSRGKISG